MDLIIYHKNCPDGFCAAFIAKKMHPEAELFGATYGEPAPFEQVKDKEVLVVDFCWPREITLQLCLTAKSFEILDHHKTAEAALAGLNFAVFDMNESGASLTWDRFHPHQPRPWYVEYVKDRDLWLWKLPESKEVSGFVMALPPTIEAWNQLDGMTSEQAAESGKAIRLHINHYIEKVVAQKQIGILYGHSVAIVNAAYPNISDVGNELCKYAHIGAGYFERGDGRVQFSLRSVGDLDVSAIAAQFGGGGHKNAAGFELSYSQGRELVDKILGRA